MYYHAVGESQNSHTRYVFLNEIINGQEVDYIDNLIAREGELPLRFQQGHCHMLVSGLTKVVYSGHYRQSTNQYMETYISFERRLVEHLRHHDCDAEVFLDLYGGKQIVVIYSIGAQSSLTVEKVAWYAQNSLQLLYEDAFLTDGVYCNQTFYCNTAIERKNIQNTYLALMRLANLSFYFDAPMILSPEEFERLRLDVGDNSLRETRHNIFHAVNTCDEAMFGHEINNLLLNYMKHSVSNYQLEYNLLALKRFYLQTCSAYDISLIHEVDKCFDYREYPKIEQLTERLRFLLGECIDHIKQRGTQYSRIVQEAIQILKNNFSKPDISLTYVAEQVGVSRSYLSSLFNKEMQVNLSSYIIQLRIVKAKALLKETELFISEIATAVGLESSRYFSSVFKRETGRTPKEFRLLFDGADQGQE